VVFINVSLYGTPQSLFACYTRTKLIKKFFCALKDLNYNDILLINTFLELLERVLECGQLPQHRVAGKNAFRREM
jgi:hypothetical protein